MSAWVIATRPYPEKVLGGGSEHSAFAAGGVFFLLRDDAEAALVERRKEFPEIAHTFGVYPALITVYEAGQKP